MAKFVFQLEAVLRQRQHVERQRQRELAEVQAQVAGFQDELRLLNGRVQNSTEDLRQNHLTGKLDLSFIAAHRRFMLAMQRKGVELMQKMALLQRQVEQARAALAEAAKQKKIIDKLRERQHERWLAEQNRREMLELDEIGTQLSYRNGRPAAEAAP